MTFPQVAAHAESGTTYGTSTFNATMPSGIAAGDLLIAYGASSTDVDQPDPSGWTRVAVESGSYYYSWVWAKIAAGSDALAINRSSSGADVMVVVYRVTGHSGSLAALEVGTYADFSGDWNPPSLTASWGSADNLWIAGVFRPGGTEGYYSANYTSNQAAADNPGAGWGGASLATRELTAATENPGAARAGHGTFTHTVTMVVRPEGGSAVAVAGAAAGQAAATGNLSHGVPLAGSAAAVASASGNLSVSHPGILTTPPLKNNAGTVLASETGITVHIYSMAGGLIVTKTGQVTDTSGVLVVTDPALVAAVEYRGVVVLASGAAGLFKLTSA